MRILQDEIWQKTRKILAAGRMSSALFGYTLPNGEKVKFLDDKATYLGSQLEGEAGFCYGIAAGMDFVLICSYLENGESPELIAFQKR